MQFVQVKAARFPQTSQSGSAFGGGREGADDARADATAAAAAAAAAGGVGGGEEPSSQAVDGDVPVAVVAFFPPLFFGMLVVCGSDERMGAVQLLFVLVLV